MFEGSRHCGAIRFRVDAVVSELTTCDCSLCVKRNAVMAKIPEHALAVAVGSILELRCGWRILATYASLLQFHELFPGSRAWQPISS